MRLMCMKRYSDFKTLRANLLEIVEMRRRLDARSSLSGTVEVQSIQNVSFYVYRCVVWDTLLDCVTKFNLFFTSFLCCYL